MAAIDTATRSGLAKLLRMLGTDRDGELVATVYTLRRVLSSSKLDLHDLAGIVEAPSVVPPSGSGRADSGAPRWRRWNDDNVETELPWREMVVTCMRHLDRFTDRECKFIRSMGGWRDDPSAKQLGWLVALFERVRGMP
jgi:hypothetical protein